MTLGFHLFGLVKVASATHSGKQGQIVATGTGPKPGDGGPGKRFFKLRFDDELHEHWFSEDQIFLEDDPSKPAAKPRIGLL